MGYPGYRVLDLEDPMELDEFYKVEMQHTTDTIGSVYISPTERQRVRYAKQARLRAEAIVREIDQYKKCAAWRKRLQRASRELDFVWEPYLVALRQRNKAWRKRLAPLRQRFDYAAWRMLQHYEYKDYRVWQCLQEVRYKHVA